MVIFSHFFVVKIALLFENEAGFGPYLINVLPSTPG